MSRILSAEEVDKLATVCARRFHLTLDEACDLVTTAQTLREQLAVANKENEDAKFAVEHLTEQLAIINQEVWALRKIGVPSIIIPKPCTCDACEYHRRELERRKVTNELPCL